MDAHDLWVSAGDSGDSGDSSDVPGGPASTTITTSAASAGATPTSPSSLSPFPSLPQASSTWPSKQTPCPTAPTPTSSKQPPPSPSTPASNSSEPPPPPPATRGSDDVPTRLFRFLSTATPESLSAVGVGLAATTYFVLGRVGLVLMGAFGGIAFFVAWEARHPEVSRAVQGEKGTDVLARVLDYRDKARAAASAATAGAGAGGSATDDDDALDRPFESFRPLTGEALGGLVEAVVCNYVKWWYEPIVPADASFPRSCQRVLTSFVVAVSNHLSRKRPADVFLDFLTNSSSIVIVFLSELAAAFSEPPPAPPEQGGGQPQQPSRQNSDAAQMTAAADAIYSYLAANPDSNLANLLSQRQQAGKFRMVAEDLLGFLDRPTYDCEPAHVFLREILAGSVLETMLQTCSKAEWINGWIVHLLEAGEPDFNQAIDVGMQTRASESSGNGSSNTTANAKTVNTSACFDLDGNMISNGQGQPRSRRSSVDTDKARRKESMAHRKQLSRADEEMEEAMEEMKRMNEMIAAEDARRAEKEREEREEREEKERGEREEKERGEKERKEKERGEKDSEGEKEKERETEARPRASIGSLASLLSPKASLSLSGDERPPMTGAASTPTTPQSALGQSDTEAGAPAGVSDVSGASGETGADASDKQPAQFTSFDQLVPPARDEEETSDAEGGGQAKPMSAPAPAPPPLSLHNAAITIHDEPVADKGRIKSRPAWDFLIQIEPATSAYPGWMIVRKYGDFEKLHEVLRRIATISGATAFTEQHGALPAWKVHTRGTLRGELEQYVRDACASAALAESEGMKRFLEKDTNNMAAQGSGKLGFQAFESMGKNMLDVLTNAPKGMAESSKVVVGGFTGVLGNIGSLGNGLVGGMQKRHTLTQSLSVLGSGGGGGGSNTTTTPATATTPTSGGTSVLQDVTAYTNRLSISTPPRADSSGMLSGGLSGGGSSWRSRDSMDSQRSSVVSMQPGRMAPMDRRTSYQGASAHRSQGGDGGGDGGGADGSGSGGGDALHPSRGRTDPWDYMSSSAHGSRQHSRASSAGLPRSPSARSLSGRRGSTAAATSAAAAAAPSARASLDLMGSPTSGSPARSSWQGHHNGNGSTASLSSMVNGPGPGSGPTQPGLSPSASSWGTMPPPPLPLRRQLVPLSGNTTAKQYAALTEAETRVAVELLFAVINELYTLSSAWNIRRTLLAAAKSFLLRPGNPSLASIQSMLQRAMLDAHTGDDGMAATLRRLRENVLPTEEERAAWPAPMTDADKERLRVKARRLLIRSGVPAALMGVMGQTATADALGRLFDCLQVEEVARGLLFGIILQAARVVTH